MEWGQIGANLALMWLDADCLELSSVTEKRSLGCHEECPVGSKKVAVNRRVAGSRNYAGRDRRGSWLLGSLGLIPERSFHHGDHDP